MHNDLQREFDEMVAATANGRDAITTAGAAFLSKASPTIQSELQSAYRARAKHLDMMTYGGPNASHVAKWRKENTDVDSRAMSDDDVLKTLGAAASQHGMELARQIAALETTAEVVNKSIGRAKEIFRRRASLSDEAVVAKIRSRVDGAEAELSRIEKCAERFADTFPPGGKYDSAIERRRGEIARHHGAASGRVNDARNEAASHGLKNERR
jgi:hypothetical protein